ncbi:MAG: hypothetical protein ACR2HO_08985 [Rubrobacteraceae bacterium]|nr:hypothetical protein [Rubrobacter sp.]
MQETSLILFPGPGAKITTSDAANNILVLSRGVTLGRRAALVSAVGRVWAW